MKCNCTTSEFLYWLKIHVLKTILQIIILTVCVYTIQQKNLYHYKLKFKFVDLKINKSDFELITLTFFSKIIIKQKLKQTLDLLPPTFH